MFRISPRTRVRELLIAGTLLVPAQGGTVQIVNLLHPSLSISAYDPARHPAPPPRMEKPFVVLENRSTRPITAVVAIWTYQDAKGSQKREILVSDSYIMPHTPPVAGPNTITYISQHTAVPAAGASYGFYPGEGDASQTDHTITIDAVMFADGEIAGPDTMNLAADLTARKTAAARVVQAARKAAITRNLPETLAAITPQPTTPEQVAESQHAARFAAEVLRHQNDGKLDAYLRFLESMPSPARMYHTGGK